MILKALVQNPLSGGPKPWKPWYPYLFLAVLVVSGGLYVYERLSGGPVVPTSTVPSVLYENAKLAREHQETVPETDATPDTGITKDVLLDAAKIAAQQLQAPTTEESSPEPTIPSSENLAVPFTSQAPFANWDAVHEDTCEEASVLMVMEYFDGQSANIAPQDAEDALLAIVSAETQAGYGTSLTASELGAFVEMYAPTLHATVIDDPSIDEIKAYVARGIPVIVPAAGRELGNPFFSGEGPLYHYFVIRGFDGTDFITNDPGTRHGENYVYAQSVIMSAMGDWNDGDPANGAARILVLEPRQ